MGGLSQDLASRREFMADILDTYVIIHWKLDCVHLATKLSLQKGATEVNPSILDVLRRRGPALPIANEVAKWYEDFVC